MTDEEQATVDALTAEYEALEAEYAEAEEYPDEVDERVSEIETALAAFEERPVTYDPAEIGRAGVFVSLNREGRLSVDRGFVHPEDEAPLVLEDSEDDGEGAAPDGGASSIPAVQRAVITVGGQSPFTTRCCGVIRNFRQEFAVRLSGASGHGGLFTARHRR